MTPEKLKANLNKLKKEIARKPTSYSPDYATSIDESFKKYTRTRTINLLTSLNELLWATEKWPFPLFSLSSKFSPLKFILALYSGILFTSKVLPFVYNEEKLKQLIRKFSVCLFNLNRRIVFKHIKEHSALARKTHIIDEVYKCYKNGLWYACITSATPILDFILRQYFETNSFDKDIKYLLGILKKADIDTSLDIKPGYIRHEKAISLGMTPRQCNENDLRLIGIALGSFLDFSNNYYSWFRKDKDSEEYNRHAFLHGAINKECTKEDAIKLIEFLDLTLRLEPVFKILLKEN